MIIDPLGNFALNDDWAYARSVFVWNQTGQFTIGKWPAMSLFSHSLLGLVFVKILGFSYTVLRFSNMFFCVITLFFLYKFLAERKGTKLATLICFIFILNPFYLNGFNSFMTDLTFINFSFLSFYVLATYFEKRKFSHLFLFLLLALLATFTRQTGVILFVAFVVVATIQWIKNKDGILVVYSLLCLCICLILLFYFEMQQKLVASDGMAYKGLFFFKQDVPFNMETIIAFVKRGCIMLVYTGGIFIVLGSFFLMENFKSIMVNKFSRMIYVGIAIGIFLFISTGFPSGNILYNCGVGPESTIDRVYLETNSSHASSGILFGIVISFFVIGFLLMSFIFDRELAKKSWTTKDPSCRYLIILLAMYAVLIGLSDVFFDRYSLFFTFFLTLIFLLEQDVQWKLDRKLPFILLLLIGIFSVLSAKDYFTVARSKQSIITELIKEQKIDKKQIHAGFEYELWDGTLNDFDWINFDHYQDKKFVLSSGPINGFEIFKAYPYRRYIPFKMDTIFVLRKR